MLSCGNTEYIILSCNKIKQIVLSRNNTNYRILSCYRIKQVVLLRNNNYYKILSCHNTKCLLFSRLVTHYILFSGGNTSSWSYYAATLKSQRFHVVMFNVHYYYYSITIRAASQTIHAYFHWVPHATCAQCSPALRPKTAGCRAVRK